RLAGAAVVEAELACGPLTLAARPVDPEVDAAVGVLLLPADQGLVHVLHPGAVEDRRGHVHAAAVSVRLPVGGGAVVVPAVGGDPTQVRLQDLPDLHPARQP